MSKYSEDENKPKATSSTSPPGSQSGQSIWDVPVSSEGSSKPASKYRYNCLLLVRLAGTSDPTITRVLSVPADFTFTKLAKVLTKAFGWAENHHLSKFELSIPHAGSTKPVSRSLRKPILKILDDDEWHQARVDRLKSPRPPSAGPGASLKPLKDDLPPKLEKMDDVSLGKIFSNEEYYDTRLVWTYDFGNGWDHEIHGMGIELESFRQSINLPPVDVAVCLSGEGHPCAEDCVGTQGWGRLKSLFVDPTREGDIGFQRTRAWYMNECANGDPDGLDPYKWDVAKVNAELEKIT